MNLAMLASFAPKFRLPGATASFSRAAGGDVDKDGYMVLPASVMEPLGLAFMTMLREGGWLLGPPFSAVEWIGRDEDRRLRHDRAALAQASTGQLAKLLTTLTRQERFASGTLEDALASGLLLAIAERAETLAATTSAPGR